MDLHARMAKAPLVLPAFIDLCNEIPFSCAAATLIEKSFRSKKNGDIRCDSGLSGGRRQSSWVCLEWIALIRSTKQQPRRLGHTEPAIGSKHTSRKPHESYSFQPSGILLPQHVSPVRLHCARTYVRLGDSSVLDLDVDARLEANASRSGSL